MKTNRVCRKCKRKFQVLKAGLCNGCQARLGAYRREETRQQSRTLMTDIYRRRLTGGF